MSTTAPARPANLSPEGEQALNDLHDWFEGQLAAALGNPPLSAREVEDGDEHAGSLEELIELVQRRYALPRPWWIQTANKSHVVAGRTRQEALAQLGDLAEEILDDASVFRPMTADEVVQLFDTKDELEAAVQAATPRQAEDGSLRFTVGDVAYLSTDGGLSFQRLPSCLVFACKQPSLTIDPNGYGFCVEHAVQFKAHPLDIRGDRFAHFTRRAQVAEDIGGDLAKAWRDAGSEIPESEPLDTRWPSELRAEIARLEGDVEEARSLARAFKNGDTVDPWEMADWLEDGDGEDGEHGEDGDAR